MRKMYSYCTDPVDEPMSLIVVTRTNIRRLYPDRPPPPAPAAGAGGGEGGHQQLIKALNVRAIDFLHSNKCAFQNIYPVVFFRLRLTFLDEKELNIMMVVTSLFCDALSMAACRLLDEFHKHVL